MLFGGGNGRDDAVIVLRLYFDKTAMTTIVVRKDYNESNLHHYLYACMWRGLGGGM
jgi:hypothetical protein